MEQQVSGEAKIAMRDRVTMQVRRGAVSWGYIYVALGFVLTIEGTFISMVKPWKYPSNVEIYAAVTVLTVYLFVWNTRFRVLLLRLKAFLEDRPD